MEPFHKCACCGESITKDQAELIGETEIKGCAAKWYNCPCGGTFVKLPEKE